MLYTIYTIAPKIQVVITRTYHALPVNAMAKKEDTRRPKRCTRMGAYALSESFTPNDQTLGGRVAEESRLVIAGALPTALISYCKSSHPPNNECVVVCVFLPIHSGLQVRWTYKPGSHRRTVTQEAGHTGFLIHLPSAVRAFIFLARRIQPFLPLVDREVEFCVLTIQSFCWAFVFLVFSFLVRKIPFAGIELTSQRVRRLHGYL